jgi:hypothetical protein
MIEKFEEHDEKFGVIMILPECAFSAEFPRGSVSQMMLELDDRLTEQGTPEETGIRCELMMDNALALSSMVANREIEHVDGVTNIAYCFIYAFTKSIGFEQINSMRGLTGTYIKNQCRLNPCLNDFDFEQQERYLSKQMADHGENDEWDFDINIPPTLH